MPAYLVAELTVIDPDLAGECAADVAPLLARRGGRYITAAPPPTTAKARRSAACFYDDPAYAPLIEKRARAAQSRLAIVAGSPE